VKKRGIISDRPAYNGAIEMAEYIRRLADNASYTQKGLKGFKFPLANKNAEVYFVEAEQGHDNYIVSKKCTHIYYVLEGNGIFDIENGKTQVKTGQLIEVPPKAEYTYSGKMKLLLIMNPPWFKGNEKITKKNPCVR
jgi:mannose-6-phosphate isomerase-like protein (cupin superfamily)